MIDSAPPPRDLGVRRVALGAGLVVGVGIAVISCATLAGIDDPAPIGTDDAPSGISDASSDGAFCQNQDATFCADFENVASAGVGWTQPRGAQLITDIVASGRASMLSSVRDAASGCAYNDLAEIIDGNYTSAHFELKIRPGYADAAPAAGILFTLGFGAAPSGCLFLFSVENAAMAVQVQYQGDNYGVGTFPKPAPGAYGHYAMDLGLKNGSAALTVRLADEVVLDVDSVSAPNLAKCPLGGAIAISVGIFCDQSASEARFDDIALDVH